MSKLAKAIFLQFGISEADADKYLSSDEAVTKDLKAEDIYTNISDTFKEKFKSDGTLQEMVSKKIGEVLTHRDNEMRKLAKTSGVEITNDEYNNLPKENKSDHLAKLILEKIQQKKGGSSDDKDKEIEKLNAEVLRFKDEVKKYEEEVIPKVKVEAQSQIESFQTEIQIKGIYQNTLGGKLISDESKLYPAVIAQVQAQYDLKMKDGQLAVFKKGTDVQAFNGNKAITLEEVFTTSAKDFIKKQDPPEKKVIKVGEEGAVKPTAGMKKAQEEIERRKAEAGK